jgi:hypothetical protein
MNDWMMNVSDEIGETKGSGDRGNRSSGIGILERVHDTIDEPDHHNAPEGSHLPSLVKTIYQIVCEAQQPACDLPESLS